MLPEKSLFPVTGGGGMCTQFWMQHADVTTHSETWSIWICPQMQIWLVCKVSGMAHSVSSSTKSSTSYVDKLKHSWPEYEQVYRGHTSDLWRNEVTYLIFIFLFWPTCVFSKTIGKFIQQNINHNVILQGQSNQETIRG